MEGWTVYRLQTSISIAAISLALALSNGPARASIHHTHYSQWSQSGHYWSEPAPRIIRRKRMRHHVNHHHRHHNHEHARRHHWWRGDDLYDQRVHRTKTST